MEEKLSFSAKSKQKNVSLYTKKTLHEWGYWLIAPLVLVVMTLITYVNSLQYPFQFDDIANISRKFAIRFDNPFQRWWGSARWVGEWLNTVNYKIGGFEPFFYRLFNLIVHIAAGLVAFYLILTLCSMAKRNALLQQYRLPIAFLTAALFLLHPVQTQTVSYVIQARLEGLASLFVLLTIFLFTRIQIAQSWQQKIVLYFFFALSIFLSCGTKELVVVLPALLLLVDWFFICDQDGSRFGKHFAVHLFVFAVFAFFVWHHLGDRFTHDVLHLQASTGNNRGNILTERPFDSIMPYQYCISQFRVILHYITIFFWPFNISVEYDWKLAPGFFSAQVIFPFILLALLFSFIVFSIFRKKNIGLSFGLSWFLISIAPRSTIIPSPELVCDYKTYLASFGMMFLLALLLVRIGLWIIENIQALPPVFNQKHVQVIALGLLMIPVAVSSYSRNLVWETTVAFWEDNVKKAPNKARAHNNLGVALSEVGRFTEAIKCYERAIALDKAYSDPLSNIAVAYSMINENDKAIEALKGAILICPNYPEAYNNLGTLLLHKKDYANAEQILLNAIELRPYYGKAYYNLARLYEEQGDSEKSWTYLKKATEGDFDSPEIFFKLGQMSLKVKKYKEAAAAFQAVIDGGVNDPQIWFNLANAEFFLENYEKSAAIYKQLVQQDPLDARYAYNLGETYFTMGDYERSLEAFQQATNVPKTLPQAFFRTVACLEKLERTDEALAYLGELSKADAHEDFKKMVQAEMTRIDLQTKINAGNGMIPLNDLKTAFAPYNTKDALTTGTTSSQVIHIKLPQST